MDLERMAQLEDCLYQCDRLLNDLQSNREDISRCVGTDAAQTYRALMDGMRKEMKAVRSDLLYLRQLG